MSDALLSLIEQYDRKDLSERAFGFLCAMIVVEFWEKHWANLPKQR